MNCIEIFMPMNLFIDTRTAHIRAPPPPPPPAYITSSNTTNDLPNLCKVEHKGTLIETAQTLLLANPVFVPQNFKEY
eukprot:3333099-Amphidinium_carterae.1